MINLETPKKFRPLVGQAHQVAMNLLRPNSRRYDLAEHEYPKELDMLAAMVDGLSESGAASAAPARPAYGARTATPRRTGTGRGTRNGSNLASVLSIMEMCWGDVGLLLSMPRQGLGNSAIASVAERRAGRAVQGRLGRRWRSPSRAAARTRRTSAPPPRRDGDDYVINGEKIYVTAGDRCDAVVVWATLDKSLGRAAIKSFVVPKGTPGHDRGAARAQARDPRPRTPRRSGSRTAGCPQENLLGSPDIDPKQGFAGAMATFDNTRPLVAAMAVGCARASLELTRELLEEAGVVVDYDRPAQTQSAAAATFLQLEADWEAAYLLTLQAAWMADNRKPNSLEASMAKAKAGRVGSDITLRCVELAGSVGYSEHDLLEKWARDSKILDIFEGTQQIQQLIVARRLLGKTSAELK